MQTAKQLKQHKRRLITKKTPSEGLFEGKLKTIGVDYKCQMILGFYILDFVLPLKMLNIEIDGGCHQLAQRYDRSRDGFVKKCGLKVMRIKNEDVETFDITQLLNIQDRTIKEFRSALGKGNAYRGFANPNLQGA